MATAASVIAAGGRYFRAGEQAEEDVEIRRLSRSEIAERPALAACNPTDRGRETVAALACAEGRVLPVVLDGKMHAVGRLADGVIVRAVINAVVADFKCGGRDPRMECDVVLQAGGRTAC